MRTKPGATRDKVAITLPKELLQRAREEILAGKAPSLSALIAQSLEQTLVQDELQRVLDEMAPKDPARRAELLAWAGRILDSKD